MKKYIKPYFETRKSEFRIMDGLSNPPGLKGAGGDGNMLSNEGVFEEEDTDPSNGKSFWDE